MMIRKSEEQLNPLIRERHEKANLMHKKFQTARPISRMGKGNQ